MSQPITWPASAAMFNRNVILSSAMIQKEATWMIFKWANPSQTREDFDMDWSYREAKEHGRLLGIPHVREDVQ